MSKIIYVTRFGRFRGIALPGEGGYSGGMAIQVMVEGQPPVAIKSGRVAKMVLYLIRQQQRIGQVEKGMLVFHFAGKEALTADLTQMEMVTEKG